MPVVATGSADKVDLQPFPAEPAEKSSMTNRTNVFWTGLVILSAVAVGVCDYSTGPELSFSIFYLLPIVLAAWKLGLGAGLFVSVASALMWFAAEYMWDRDRSVGWIPYWNTLVRFGFFVITVWLISKSRRLTETLQERAITLSEQIRERQRMELLYVNEKDILKMIAQGRPLPEVLDGLMEKVAAWSKGIFCSILVHDENGEPLLHKASPRLWPGVPLERAPLAKPGPEPGVPKAEGAEVGQDEGVPGTVSALHQ
jgi:hypothetical protein